MKAIFLNKYGAPHRLQLQEISKPIPKKQEVLVKIHSTAVNDYDWSMVRGKPLLYRLMFGLTRPKIKVPGMELSGTVEAVGSEVKSLKVGDEVYGDTSDYGFGSFAEYICINENALRLKPSTMSFVEAAAIPHASLLAYQGLVDVGNIQKAQKVLINGAGGGVGTFGLQIAKLYDAEVTGVDTGEKLQMMKSLGFDRVLDYKKQDFTRIGEQYDLILDAKTNRSPFAYLRSLRPKGKYVTVGGKISSLIFLLMLKPLISRSKGMYILALKPNKGLEKFSELFETKKMKAIIDGPYPLNKAPWAIQYFGEGHHQGKVIISNRSM